MNLPTSVVIPGIDSPQILDQAFEASGTFRPISKEQVAALLQKTEQAAAHGDYELFKTSQHFDSTAHHPEWLGRQSPHVQHLARPASYCVGVVARQLLASNSTSHACGRR